MQVFKTDKKIYFRNEVKRILLTSLLFLVIFFALTGSTSLSPGKLYFGLAMVLILHFRDLLIPYRVNKIIVDAHDDKIVVQLKSLLLGVQENAYELSVVKTEITANTGLRRILPSPLVLRISLPSNKLFEITTQYGFSKETLYEVVAVTRPPGTKTEVH